MRLDEIRQHLVKDIIPFWMNLKDDEYGGFYGEMDYELILDKKAVKGGILNSRILWFFSNAYLTLGIKDYLAYADHAFEYMKKAFLDIENGGIYWSVSYDGQPVDDTKHTYNQAFAIYALASYYGATKKREALDIAYGLAQIIETVCKDEIGYLEAFDREFRPVANEKLSENGLMAYRTMNTLLHIFEAYTELYRVDKREELADKLKWMLELFANKVYNPRKRRLEVFFDYEMNSIGDLHSYGHDIEASGLIDRGCEVLKEEGYTQRLLPITKELVRHVYEVAYDGTSLFNECFEGEVDDKKVWWVQAEALVGFLNAYQTDPDNEEYLTAAAKTWEFTKEYVIDHRAGSEWYNEVYRNGEPIKGREIVGPWKCPYHNGRMCFEVVNRNINF